MTAEDCMISYLPLAHMYERLAQVHKTLVVLVCSFSVMNGNKEKQYRGVVNVNTD